MTRGQVLVLLHEIDAMIDEDFASAVSEINAFVELECDAVFYQYGLEMPTHLRAALLDWRNEAVARLWRGAQAAKRATTVH